MSSLEQLARPVGIQELIPTSDGGEQPITSKTRRTLFAAMGIAAADEHQASASLHAFEQS